MLRWTTPTTQTARKGHWCSTCNRRIDRGETYTRGRGFDAGDAWTFKTCAHCAAVTSIYDPRDSDDCISDDGFLGWTENPPDSYAEARAMVGWRAQWRYRSGRLMPVPQRPAKADP